MAEKTITSTNSVFTLLAPGLYPVPVQLQGYATDKAFAIEALDMAETMMGVDGKLSAGYTPNPSKMTITLQADSVSKDVFDTIIQGMKTAREIYWLTGTLVLPATGESFAMTRGVLTNVKQLPDGQKVLQPLDYVITWENVSKSIL